MSTPEAAGASVAEPRKPDVDAEPPTASHGHADDEEDEEDGKPECAFCTYMKGGGCRDAFVAWEACVDACRQDDSDFAKNCHQQTMALQTCMMKHREYYGPMLEEEERYAEAESQKASEAQMGEDTQAQQAPQPAS